tara:strand:+ start:570 stop:803 length:234 start_codon:yes stop_codon:yes gene_type:complete
MKILITLLTSLFLVSNASADNNKLEGITATEVVRDGKLFKEKGKYDIYLYKDEFYECSFFQLTIGCFKLKDEGVYLE